MSDEETYVTKSGKVLTNTDIEALADEAERGYDVTGVRPRSVRAEHTLLSTTDAHVWAEEFCRIYSGKVVTTEESEGVDPDKMVTWFASAIETGSLRAER